MPEVGDGGEFWQGSEHDAGSVDAERWLHDQALIRAARAHNTHQGRRALEQLCEEHLGPIAAKYAGGCPAALVGRFCTEARSELDRAIRTTGDKLEQAAWSHVVRKIQDDLVAEMEAAAREWYLIVLVNAGHAEVEAALLERYSGQIERLARRYLDRCPEIIDDLIQEGRIAFRDDVLQGYNPDKGVTLAEFTHVVLRNKMSSLCRKWAKLGPPEPLYMRVMEVVGRLRQRRPGYEPTTEEIAVECKESLAKVRWVLKKRRVDEVTSLDEGWEDEEAPSTIVADPMADPAVLAEGRVRYEPVVKYLNNWRGKGSDGMDGVRWLVLFVLKEYEGYEWEEIVAAFGGSKRIDWITLHEVYSLPYTVPAEWEQIYRLFGPGSVKMTETNLRKWYDRRTQKLEEGLDRRDLK